MTKSKTVLALICLLLPAVAAADPVLEGRVERLERILSTQSLSDLVLQIQRLEQELQTLRGQVEVYQHELNTLKAQQREQYTDLDSRLRGGAPPGSAAPPVVTPAPTPTPQAAAEPAPAMVAPVPAPAPAEGERDAYNAAFDLLKQRQYDPAIRAFQDLLARWPAGEFADNARYWLGETYYVKREYPAALTEFQRVISEHPGSQKAAGALLKVGYIHHDLGDLAQARTALLDVITLYPDSTESRLAQSRLDRIAKDTP